jgi:hypothetical protein
MMYQAMLFRDPDYPGADGWIARVSQPGGVSIDVDAFIKSAEFNQFDAPRGRQALVENFYRVIFGRDIDPSGTQSYITNTSISLTNVVLTLLQSPEFASLHPDLAPLMR